MSYQVLARKWRPKNFHELVGQDHVRKALVSALDNDRLHHAYLFTGTRGVGKTTIARIIAKCLNCETGVTSRPCGECTSCREIDEGRFVDLIEVDAASRTKVEDTRELLDNVQYAPSRGRYKVYLIDEVHMLSTHSFNALLKTLEEPPPHVKFLLATTDPQKLPVTVLSRCLQFNLKNMPPERVVEHLSNVLTQEQIPFEDAALWQLGRAADGSMRDALSLTDQAIAYGQGSIDTAQVSEMLGLVDHRHVGALIDHLINRDAKALLSEVARLSEQAADFETILSDMALYLHRMAVAQVLPDAVDNAQGDREQVLSHASRLTAEDVQLYYQISIKSQEDLPLAPDARTGFEMALIRMVAFAPQGVPSENGNPLPSQAAPLNNQASPQASAPIAEEDEAKKKALTDVPAEAQDHASLSVPQESLNAASENRSPEPAFENTAPEPVVEIPTSAAPSPAFSPESKSHSPEPSTNSPESSANSQEPQLVKFSPPGPRPVPQVEAESEVPSGLQSHSAEPQGHQPAPSPEAGSTVQNARASLGGGLRTVQFPTASAEKVAQAEARASQPGAMESTSSLAAETPPQATNPGNPSDVPPWEELPVIPEQVETHTDSQIETIPAVDTAHPVENNVVSFDPTQPQADSQFEPQSSVSGHEAPVFDERMPPLDMGYGQPVMDEHSSGYPEQSGFATESMDASYQNMMPEPVSEQPRQAPVLRDAKLPEAKESEITPLVGPCPAQLTSNQDWLQAFAHLPLKGLDRSLAKNAALLSREGNHLKFALKAVTENFLTPEREASWQQSIQTLFNDTLTIEIAAFSTDLDTPEDYEAALKETRQRQAENLFAADPVVQGLQQAFGAEVVNASVEPLI
ncbi:DNA polymerase III subunit gamma/tau [Oceanospirillum sanctuarii]|uniref:DNA polymerase III subunit gamma/tau n=1 Tax=Oceanospirillum sanctuarii TaxID=1434821 RepID=UPI000A36AA9A|nr:DNA polymerase III subunit gamma/tau [Oceanospirillum sanctuarii]